MALSLPLENLLQQFKRVQVICNDDELAAQVAVPGTIAVVRRTGAVLNAIVRWTHEGELDVLRAMADIRVQVFPMGLEEIFLELFGDLSIQPDGPQDSKKGWD